jgi:hypothetical protein
VAAAIASSKAKSGETDEEEKTTIEHGWEDEASTTVEQGEIAAKLRAIGTDPPRRTITSVTSTNSTNLEEPTMDDQRANAALANLPVLTPSEMITPVTAGKLICTGGNDVGREFELRPGKSYSIGRAIDNDVVLTDISVSRKHFDLHLDNGTWVLVDRGSGNGTLINGSVEDAPFLLANDDQIEIGNTTFRFNLPSAPAPMPHVARVGSYEVDLGEEPSDVSAESLDMSQDGSLDEPFEEPSTVAGKPLREVAPEPAPERAYIPPVRPKTLPPPAPRTRPNSPQPYAAGSAPMGAMIPMPIGPNAMTVQPHAGMPALQLPPALPMSVAGAMPQSTLPLPQMANRPPPMVDPFMPSTLPGQAPPRVMPPLSYPPFNNLAHPNELPPYVSPPGTPIMPGMMRGDSTALLAPAGYDPPIASFAAPNRSAGPRKVKLILGGVALTLLAAAATIAIIRHSSADVTGDSADTDKPKKIEPSTPLVAPVAPPDQPKHSFKPPLPPSPPAPVPPPSPPSSPPTATQHVQASTAPPTPSSPQSTLVLASHPPTPTPTPSAHQTPPTPQLAQPLSRTPQPPQTSVSADDLRARAAALYRQKNFASAAQSLRDGYKNMSATERKNLPSLAKYYEWVGNGFAVGSSTRATDAFSALSTAIAADRNLEGAYIAELEPKQQALSAKAALSFAINGQLESALSAIHIAESAGIGAGTVQAARVKLDQKAADLYGKATAEKDANPKDAKALARQILRFVDQKSPWYAKAEALLSN